MPDLPRYTHLLPGATITARTGTPPPTRGWRLGRKPRAEASRCVNCLLCWVYCPDCAIVVDGTTFLGFDYEVCKGCEVCVAACPTGAITMVDEATRLPPLGLMPAGPHAHDD